MTVDSSLHSIEIDVDQIGQIDFVRSAVGIRGERETTSVLRELIIRITVEPPFTWLRRRDHGMRGLPRMLRGVAIRRVVTAECHSALLTRPQVDPAASGLDALFAHVLLGLLH